MTDTTAAQNEPEEIEALLSDLNLPDAPEEIVEETIEEETVEELAEGDLEKLEADLERAEIYQAQETTTAVGTTEPAVKTKKGSKAASPATPRAPRDMNAVAPEFFVLSGDASAMTDEQLKDNKTTVMASIPAQKKIAEKFENLFTAISAGKKPSTYTVTGFKLLDEKGSVTSADVIAALKAAGAGEGTARSQTGQLMNLFATVKIADRAGQTLTKRADSALADRLRKIVA